MSAAAKRRIACPTCQSLIQWSAEYPYRPFCSERCKLMDLGQWATEQYRVAGDAAPEPDQAQPSADH